MPDGFDIWKLLAGAALFLIGIGFMEEALKDLAGRRFKLFLKKQTGNKIRAIAGGAVVTALMQSSTVVNLLILSLVGAGVLKLQNALAVMLGSNLGTTFTGWVIATFGFQLNIESFSLPILAVAGLMMVLTAKNTVLNRWSVFLAGFSFLFVGLGYMNEGMAEFVRQTDLTRFSNYPLVVFIIIGLILTALVQASSITVALTLSALFTQAITLHMAAAIVLGAEIGTTLKLALASLKGLAVKKRVALGNILFNTITSVVMMLLLNPVLQLIVEIMNVKNPLYALVLFQSFINLSGIILFFPFLNVFGRFLEKRFRDESSMEFLNKVSTSDTEMALDAFEKETKHFLLHLIEFGKKIFNLNSPEKNADEKSHSFLNESVPEMYDAMKFHYGELHTFYMSSQKHINTPVVSRRFDQLMSSIRNTMYGAKSIKDAIPDIEHIRNSSNDSKYSYYLNLKEQILHFYDDLLPVLDHGPAAESFDQLLLLYKNVQADYAAGLKKIYAKENEASLSAIEISTLLNLNREMITAHKSVIYASKDYLLLAEKADYFDELPGFIR
jgi:phosphate:Na+ symporter